MRILVVDDEKTIVKGIKFNLENDGFTVDCAYTGTEALGLFNKNNYDLIILDLMLPETDGLTVCRKIRESSNVPIIMLTAKTENSDKILGFEYGADDYVTKPFDILELRARIRVILRRAGNEPVGDDVLTSGPISVNLMQRSVKVGDTQIELTAKEFDLLVMLMKNRGRVFSRENLLNSVWEYEYPGDIRTVDVHVRRLREKLEADDSNPKYILTKWGVGYYFAANREAKEN